MAQRQFRSDDTSAWGYRYGSSADGAYNPSSSTDSLIAQACTGTSGGTALTATTTGFSTGDLVLIHQTQGTGAGQWELNAISNITGFALVYPLINTYATGAQVIKLKQYSSGNIGSGVTITGQSWNGSTGGIYVLLANGPVTIAGTLSMNGIGFRGQAGEGTGDYVGRRGEGSSGNDTSRTTSAQGNGGGAGGYSTNGPWDQGNGGGGGGNYTGGSGGNATGGGNNQFGGGGSGGGTLTNSGCTLITLGGAGGEGGNKSSSSGTGAGGYGAGIVFIFGRSITVTGSITMNGSNGGGANYHSGCGGSGAGGAGLIKGQIIDIGTNKITTAGGPHITNNNGGPDEDGGAGGNGIVHVDYGATFTGSVAQNLNTRQDGSLNDTGGAFLFNVL